MYLHPDITIHFMLALAAIEHQRVKDQIVEEFSVFSTLISQFQYTDAV